MSGVDYSNPLVAKSDLHRVEKRIETNTILTQIPLASAANVLYYDATTKAVSYNTAPGGGGGGAPICLVANHETAVTIPSSVSTITLNFDSFAASLNGFSAVGSNTFRWTAGRSAVFVATFVARVTNSNTSGMALTPQFVRVAAQLFAGTTGSLAAVPFSTGSCMVATQPSALAGDSESTTESTLTICSTRFGLNNNQELQVRAGQNSAFASGVQFDGSSISPGGTPAYNSPAYTLYVQEVAA